MSTQPFIGDPTCKHNAVSPYLRCAMNPCGPCERCRDFKKAGRSKISFSSLKKQRSWLLIHLTEALRAWCLVVVIGGTATLVGYAPIILSLIEGAEFLSVIFFTVGIIAAFVDLMDPRSDGHVFAPSLPSFLLRSIFSTHFEIFWWLTLIRLLLELKLNG